MEMLLLKITITLLHHFILLCLRQHGHLFEHYSIKGKYKHLKMWVFCSPESFCAQTTPLAHLANIHWHWHFCFAGYDLIPIYLSNPHAHLSYPTIFSGNRPHQSISLYLTEPNISKECKQSGISEWGAVINQEKETKPLLWCLWHLLIKHAADQIRLQICHSSFNTKTKPNLSPPLRMYELCWPKFCMLSVSAKLYFEWVCSCVCECLWMA